MNSLKVGSYPQDRLYHSDHTWVKFESSNVVTFGITYFTQDFLGHITDVTPPPVRGNTVFGSTCGLIESRRSATDLIAPVTGVIESINKVLILNPSILNDDPYEKGWIARIKLENLYELAELVSASEYQDLLER